MADVLVASRVREDPGDARYQKFCDWASQLMPKKSVIQCLQLPQQAYEMMLHLQCLLDVDRSPAFSSMFRGNS